MKKHRKELISIATDLGNEKLFKNNIRYMSLSRLTKDLPSKTEASTLDSIFINSLTNRSDYSIKSEVKNNQNNNDSKIQNNTKSFDVTSNNFENNLRKKIKIPTRREKQFITSGKITEKLIKKERAIIEKESKKPKRNKDYLNIKSNLEYLKEKKRKHDEINNEIKNDFFNALEIDKNKFLNNSHFININIEEKIKKTISTTLYDNLQLTKEIKQLYLNDYIKYCEEMMRNKKKANIYEVIKKEQLDEKERTQKINEIRIRNEKKKALRKKILIIILTLAAHLYRSRLSISQFLKIHEESLDKLSFFREDFDILKTAIKNNNERKVKLLVEGNKYLCQMFDDFNQTALHVAAKRPRGEIIKLILKSGAKIDAQDIAGRTALHYACLYNNLENVEILLHDYASPLKLDNLGKEPGDYTTDKVIKFFIDRAKTLVDLSLSRINIVESLKRIRSGLEYFFNIPERKLRRMIG